MLRPFCCLFIFLAVFFFTYDQNAVAQEFSYDHVTTEDIDKIFSRYDRSDRPGCAVGVVCRGELIFAKGYGSANLDYRIPIGPDSRFMIASISKQFAAAALVMLEQEGKLDLDEDLRTYIPELPEFDYPITARQIIHHTSGLRDIYSLLILGDIGLDNLTTSDQALELIGRQRRLNFRPDSEYLYSNSGYFLMSVLVKNLSGMSLREYTDKHFLRPIGMSSTHWHDDTGDIVPNRAISYRPMSYGPGEFYRGNMDRVGARGLFTTIEDMALWDANFIENKSNLENFTERMTQTGITLNGDTIDYAIGLRVSRYKTLRTVGHGGNYMGFRTNYLRFPEHELSVIVFCNMSNINPATYTRQVADVYLKEAFEERLREYTGRFRNDSFGTVYEIVPEDGDIYLKKGFNDSDRLIWRGDDEFRAGRWDVKFLRNGNGDIDGMEIKAPRTGTVTFKRIS